MSEFSVGILKVWLHILTCALVTEGNTFWLCKIFDALRPM